MNIKDKLKEIATEKEFEIAKYLCGRVKDIEFKRNSNGISYLVYSDKNEVIEIGFINENFVINYPTIKREEKNG